MLLLRGSGAVGDDAWCDRIRGPVAAQLLELDLAGVSIGVRDAAVRGSLMTLTTLDPPVQAVVNLWTQQHFGPAVQAAIEVLAGESESVAGYLVTESAPLPPPQPLGERTPGLCNVALLRRPAELPVEEWRRRWQLGHTQVAIDTQATFGYVQNAVVRPLTPQAPELAAIVEELFPIEAVGDLMAFFGAADEADLNDRLGKMVASTSAFGANQNIDTVPTSRYVLRSPFHR